MPKIGSGHLQIMPPAPAGVRRIELEAASVTYRLVRSQRRSIAIHIGQSGVEARAPQWAALADIESFMRRKARWIVERLEDVAALPPFDWNDGARLPLLGESVTLLHAADRIGISLEQGRLLIGRGRFVRQTGPNDRRKRVIAWIRAQALAHFHEGVARLAPQLGVPQPAVSLSNAHARWGSCSVHGQTARIRLHWKLYLMPPHLIDYVIVHELAHILELNHSPRFWAQVERLCPDYLTLRKDLNRHGRALPLL